MDSEKPSEITKEATEIEVSVNKEKEKDKVKEKASIKSQNQLNSGNSLDVSTDNGVASTAAETQQQQQKQPQQQQSQTSQAQKKKKSAPSGKSNQRPIKRRRKREEGAPKLPLTGYVRYMNSRRDSVKQEYPDKTSVEHTKIIADEWNHMSEESKKPYLQAAEVDRERYNKQMTEFNKMKKVHVSANNENVRQNSNSGHTKSVSNNSSGSNGSNTSTTGTSIVTIGRGQVPSTMQNGQGLMNHTIVKPFIRRYGDDNSSIPIFTDEFLEHNKTVDTELRTLRKSNTDYEQQNSVLEKHIESMKFGVEKMQTENTELIEKNILLEAYLHKLKLKLAQAFSGLSIPTEPNGATIENIDKYMSDLHNMVSSNSHGPASLNKAKDIIRKLDLQIQL